MIRTPHPKRLQSGFTIVEIVVAIFLVGILSAVTISRFLDGNAFNASIVRDQIISLARIAQQSALGRDNVRLTITPNGAGDSVTIAASESNGAVIIDSATVSLDSVTLNGDINITSSCEPSGAGNAITAANPMIIEFGKLGELKDTASGAGAGTITKGVRVCLNASALDSVCVSPSGFAYAGDCDG